MNEKVFTEGIIFKLPRENAPDFVKGSLSFKVDEAIAWLQRNSNNGWCNVDLKVGQSGKAYAELNTWKPKDQDQTVSNTKKVFEDDLLDIPF